MLGRTPKYWIFSIYLALACCACSNQPAVSSFPAKFISSNDFIFRGAFTLPVDQYGHSSINWTNGVMEANGDSLFIMGNQQEDAIAEFKIPPLGMKQFPTADKPVQPFEKIFNKLRSNDENLDHILGLELHEGKLLLNAVEYYDAPADNRLSTIVIDDPGNLADSFVKGPFALRGRARAAGWLSSVPYDWQGRLRCSNISGSSSGGPIISRFSVGPSAFCVNLSDFFTATNRGSTDSRELLGFSLNSPLNSDLFNESGRNNIWTHLSQATYGFIIPGTTTYATFGNSGGHQSGVGYKLNRGDGDACGGYCAINPDDNQRYYWFWDMRELMMVLDGRKAPSSVKPYAWGEWQLPYIVSSGASFGGASYDASRGLFYISLLDTGYGDNPDTNPPVILAYSIKN